MLLVIVVSTWTLAFLFRLLFAFVALVDIFVVALLIAKTLLAAQRFVLVVVQWVFVIDTIWRLVSPVVIVMHVNDLRWWRQRWPAAVAVVKPNPFGVLHFVCCLSDPSSMLYAVSPIRSAWE